MKNRYFLLTVTIVIAGLVLTGFYMNRDKYVKNYQDKEKQANQGMKKEKTKFDKEWKEFKSNAEIKINANEKRIGEFKVKIKTASKEVKADYDKEITVLEQKNVELKKKINEYKYEGKDKWEEFKQGFNRDMDIVGKALKDLWAKKD
jgi:FtsZ-interacting cell division protein ZipA